MSSITPKIWLYGEWFELKPRPLWVCPNGFAAVTYKGRIRRLCDDFSILQDSEHTFDKDQCSFFKGLNEELKFVCTRQEINAKPQEYGQETQDPFSGALELRKKRTLTVKIHHSHLAILASMGVDRAIHALIQQNSKAAQNALRTAIKFRPRFEKTILLDDKIVAAQSQTLMILEKEFLKLPFKYFMAPIGRGDFSRLPQKLDRSITNHDILNIINSSDEPPDLLRVRNFKAQAAASLAFHNEMLRNYNNASLERDISSSIIEDSSVANFVYGKKEKLQEVIKNNHKLLESNELSLAVSRCSNRAKVRLSGWKESTFEAFYTLATRMPRHLKLSEKQIDLMSPEYPLLVKKLSIFALISTTKSQFLQKKYVQLHECGIKNISDLILMHSDLFRLFFRK